MKHALRIIPFACLWIGWFGCLPVSLASLLLTGNDSGIRLWWASSVILALAAWINWLLHRRDRYGAIFVCGKQEPNSVPILVR